MLLDEHTRHDAPGEAATFRPCAHCNAGLLGGQEWCLECGERQPSRETKARGRRTAATIVGGVFLLAVVGFTLSWVALKDDARGASHDLLSGNPAAALGDTAAAAGATGQPAPGTPGASSGAPTTTTPLNPGSLPKLGGGSSSTFIPVTPAKSGGSTTASGAQGGTAGSGTKKSSTPSKKKSTAAKKKKHKAVVLPKVPTAPAYQGGFSPTNAVDQDPYGSDGGEHPRLVRNAIDRNPVTAWSTQDYPNGLGKPGVGIYFDIGAPMDVTRLKLTTDTPGFVIRVYGAQDAPLSTSKVPGPGWTLVSQNAILTPVTDIALSTKQTAYEYYLVWIMSLPPGSQHVDINEVSVRAHSG